jgi:hypothetical protein
MAAPARTHFEKLVTLSIAGIAIDDFGDGLPDISISIPIGTILVQSTRSDLGGSFEFRNVKLEAAIHSVEARTSGYRPADERLHVKPELEGKTVNLRLSLRLESLAVPSAGIETEGGLTPHIDTRSLSRTHFSC